MRSRLLFSTICLVLYCGVAAAQVPGAGITLLASNGALYGTYENTLYDLGANGGTTTLNTNDGGLSLCLETPGGLLLGTSTSTSGSLQLVAVTLTGAITPIAQLPSGTQTAPCPAMASDGNYYGSGFPGGTYGNGYLYQLTSAGALNVFYNFVNKGDGTAPVYSPIQASDGNLYFTGGDADTLLQYSPTTGLSLRQAGAKGAPPVEGADGAFYYPNGSSYSRVTTSGATTVLATDPNGGILQPPVAASQNYVSAVALYFTDDPDECAEGYYSGTVLSALYSGTLEGESGDLGGQSANELAANLFLEGNGAFYGSVASTNNGDADDGCVAGTDYVIYGSGVFENPGVDPPLPMSLSQTHVVVGGSATVTWHVENGFSLTAQQCYGYGGLSGKLPLSGSASIKASQAGINTTAIICGGTETNYVQLSAGPPTITLTNTTTVPQGGTVTLTASLGDTGTPAPTGAVSFYVGQTLIGSAPVSANVATLQALANGVPIGTYSVVAKYSGDANYAPVASSPVSVKVVAQAQSSITLTPASQTVPDGDTVTFAATVTCNSTYDCPGGHVELVYGQTVVATVNDQPGTAAPISLSSNGIPAGTYQLKAVYPGDEWNLGSSSNPVTVVLQPAATPVTLTISPNPVPANASFTLTATVQANKPTGTVVFYDGSSELASATLNGSGVGQIKLPAGTLAAGTYSMTAYYAGDANNPSATSSAVSLTVQ